ncbi:hypothetical protein [Anaerocellum diazotrophicum]|uniref:Uncharacterized protein n=1 Tax=Caldicellulosiruptor diazotrophicus TaxID=2806205 RepID=A0ABN6E703_9FIRM|nr:hypothetical protein [Caldicellulosiruptor diazotrophicus]BCS80349.1 hypothetical protein CaldiYA01_03090 [Caldicellulosiruptor diazotrophicus]
MKVKIELIENIPVTFYAPELKKELDEWAETAKICLDDELMNRLKEAENEFKTGGSLRWEHPTNSI